MDIYLDCEWFLNQKLFIIGYAYNITDAGQLYDNSLNKQNFLKLLEPVNGYIFFYGPDIAIIEKNFNIDIRNNYICINLLRIFKHVEPNLRCYKLACLEEYYNIERKTPEYKSSIFRLLNDWRDPKKRKKTLLYNKEDVINLVRVKKRFFSEHNLSNKIPDYWRLQ